MRVSGVGALVSIIYQIINRVGEGIAATDGAGRSEGRRVRYTPSDLDKKESAKKKQPVRGRPSLELFLTINRCKVQISFPMLKGLPTQTCRGM